MIDAGQEVLHHLSEGRVWRQRRRRVRRRKRIKRKRRISWWWRSHYGGGCRSDGEECKESKVRQGLNREPILNKVKRRIL
jgi:hypothetical protein